MSNPPSSVVVNDPQNCVLVVDDYESLRHVVLRQLARAGFYVRGAPSALHAKTFLLEHPVAVLVVDQRMPHMLGHELLVDAATRSPNTRRILLTGNPFALTAEQRSAAHRVIGKGEEPRALVRAVAAELMEWTRGG